MVNAKKSPEKRRKEFLETLAIMDNSKSVKDWLESCKESSRGQYVNRWGLWIEYSKTHGLPISGDQQLADMQQRRQSTDNGIKFFYDNEIPKFFNWLKTEYVTKNEKQKHLTEGSSLTTVTGVRSFFNFNRYPLEIQKDKLPSSEKIHNLNTDHAFTIFELRDMFNLGDLRERTILDVGTNLWLRVGDFTKLDRETIELFINREKELAVNEKREPQTIEFEIITEKESEPCSCHLSKEAIELIEQYLKAYPAKDGYLFPYREDMLNDILKKLAEKAHIKLGKLERVRWHCLRKFGITIMFGKVDTQVMKYMCGKHIESSLKTYIQSNNEPMKAFKLVEPLISLTKATNGNGMVTKELEQLKKERFKLLASLKLMEKITPKEVMAEAIKELAAEFNIPLKIEMKVPETKKGEMTDTFMTTETVIPDLDSFINELSAAIEKRDLERVMKEIGNGDNNSQ
ncbi:MAG: hypothetical protein ABSF65_05640 [Candidatus Bathyarchaeia archaeon]|jgi:GTPase SAR1 family protein